MAKVGIANLNRDGNWEDTRELAVLADDLRYDCITVGEAWGGDAFTTLAHISALTKNIRIGTSIVPVFARSPANLAMAAINLDNMSGGRFFLGLGASGKLVIEDLHGEVFRKPLTRLREYIEIVRMALNGEKLEHEGEFFSTKRFRLRIQPTARNMPIYIASLSPPSLRLTGEIADGWFPIFLAPERMSPLLEEIQVGASRSGRNLHNVTISPQVSIYVTDDVQEARNKERPHIAWYIGGMGIFYHEYMHRIGFGEESDKVKAAFDNRDRDRAAELVTDEMVEATTIIGDPVQCKEKMDMFFSLGVNEIRLVFNEDSNSKQGEAMRSLAKYIN